MKNEKAKKIKIDKNKTERIKDESNFIKVLKGSIISIIISLVLLFIIALILTFTNISERIIPIAIISISVISILTGSIISTMHIKKNGIVNGGLVGAIYIITIYLLSSIVISDFGINLKSLLMGIAAICAGVIGGIVGVNIYNK